LSVCADIERVVGFLRSARRVLVITGAGVSAESGLPTYRGVGGLYNSGGTEEGIPVEVALSGMMFEQRPELTWTHIRRLEESCRGATFNPAHTVVAQMEDTLDAWVLTQNVDGFHRAAGSRNVIDIHGDVHDLKCTVCEYRQRLDSFETLEPLPRCPVCGEVIRPDVVLFGEMLPVDKVALLHQQLDVGFDMVFSIGTTSLFPYISGPVVAAARDRIPTVEINPATTEVSGIVDVKLTMGAAEACIAFWERYRSLSS
jgi:NAD-dependent deacetylase